MSQRPAATVLETRRIHRGKLLDLRVDRVRLPNGHQTDLELIRHPGAAAMVALDDRGQVALVRQYRHATGGWILEVPAGKLDAGEPPAVCAERELAEEIGRRPAELVELGWIWTTPGFTDEKIWLFLARRLTPVDQELEDDELLEVEILPLELAVELVHRGEIRDAKSVAALLLAARWLQEERPDSD
ncbi:MAG TPA: NUDIX hydrolase [Thermoanaerobaculia bacterium]|nr:NUDIX hydrolase [Thermoanaerobaculia bacterium]